MAKRAHMAISRLESVGMADQDVVAVTTLALGNFNNTAARRQNWRSALGGPVGTKMHLAPLVNWMTAHAKAGGVTGALDGLAHQELLRAVPVLVIEIYDAIRCPETEESPGLVVERHRGEQQFTRFGFLTLLGAFKIEKGFEMNRLPVPGA